MLRPSTQSIEGGDVTDRGGARGGAYLKPCHRRVNFAGFLICLWVMLIAAPACAQQEDTQAWEQVNVVVPIAPRLRVTLEEIARTSDRQGGVYTSEFGGLIGWQLAKGVELGVGYRYVSYYNGNTAPDEDRLRQQVVVTSGRFAGRLRLDERFNTRGGAIGFRIRPLVRYNLPLNRKGLTLFVSHESFFLPNSTNWGQRAGYERMRNIAGFGFPIGKAVTADIGYLNQFRFARDGARAQMDHALNVQLTINLGKLGVVGLHD